MPLKDNDMKSIILILICGVLLAGCDSAEELPPVLQGRYDGTFTYIAEPGPFFEGGPVFSKRNESFSVLIVFS